ncbi:MAG: hypothetical protein ACXQT4_07760 [Methanotrichaceae archaeon]
MPSPVEFFETEQLLKDPIIMKMLEYTNRQYEEGRAIPFDKLMCDLGFEEDDL